VKGKGCRGVERMKKKSGEEGEGVRQVRYKEKRGGWVAGW